MVDNAASRTGETKPSAGPAPGGAGRLTGGGDFHPPVQPQTEASRNAQRHLRDVLADLRQCDSAG